MTRLDQWYKRSQNLVRWCYTRKAELGVLCSAKPKKEAFWKTLYLSLSLSLSWVSRKKKKQAIQAVSWRRLIKPIKYTIWARSYKICYSIAHIVSFIKIYTFPRCQKRNGENESDGPTIAAICESSLPYQKIAITDTAVFDDEVKISHSLFTLFLRGQ